MSDFAKMIEQHRRLVILRLLTDVPPEEARRRTMLEILAHAPGLMANVSLLQEAIVAGGIRAARDEVTATAAWLAEQGLASLDQSGPLPVVRLSPRGAEAAAGLVDIAGIQPLPTVAWLRDGMERVGVQADSDEVVAQCGWLLAGGLVAVDGSGLVWPILPAAAEVASGRRECEGVRMPGRPAIMRAAANAAKSILES